MDYPLHMNLFSLPCFTHAILKVTHYISGFQLSRSLMLLFCLKSGSSSCPQIYPFWAMGRCAGETVKILTFNLISDLIQSFIKI